MLKQRCLVLDIETFPIIAAVWGLKDQNIGLNQIRQDSSVMAWGAKWLGRPASEVMYRDTSHQRNVRDDRAILRPLWKLLDEADIVITQNGQSFDGPRLNARFMIHKMTPPSPYRHLDTYRIAKRVAEFTSNKLEYLTDKLNVKYKKLLHPNYQGMTLWNECEKGNKDAWREMRKYNIHDVLSDEELYENLKAWAPETMPKPYFSPANKGKCAVCGKYALTKRGVHIKKAGAYQRYKCGGCGTWTLGEKVR